MKQVLYVVAGILYGILLGYFFLFFLVHVASLHMDSDDDLNQAVFRGLLIWPILIILTAWLGHQLYLGTLCGYYLSKFQRSLFVLTGIITGTLVGDVLLSLSNRIIDWRTFVTTGEGENIVILLVWALFSFLGGIIARRWMIRYSFTKTR